MRRQQAVQALCLACLGLAVAAPITKTVPAFSTVTLCTPYNVLVTPGSDYAVVVDAEDQVQKAINPSVSGDTLLLVSLGTLTQLHGGTSCQKCLQRFACCTVQTDVGSLLALRCPCQQPTHANQRQVADAACGACSAANQRLHEQPAHSSDSAAASRQAGRGEQLWDLPLRLGGERCGER